MQKPKDIGNWDIEIIKNSDLNKEAKDMELSKILEARKDAFGENFRYVPPWKQKGYSL